MSSAVNVSDLPTRMHDSVFNFNVSLLADCPLLDFLQLHLIVGMNPFDQFVYPGQTIPWVKTQNAVAFLRPISDVGVGTPGPTTRVADFLCLCQIGFTFP